MEEMQVNKVDQRTHEAVFTLKSQKPTLILGAFLLLIIGFLCGWLGFLLVGDIAKSCQILVISKEALIAKEEERIKNIGNSDNTDNNENSIFFGKPKEALNALEEIAKTFENKRTKVIFVSNSSGAVKNGTAITDKVHKELVKVLKTKK